MAQTGVLKPDARVELLDGEIIDMSPIGPPHGGSTKYLNELFASSSKGRWLVTVQDPLHLDEHSEPQPDLMLVKRTQGFYRTGHPQPPDVFLLIEVAESSLEYDRQKKLPAYGRTGIPEVWIVNVVESVLEVYREPNLTGYASSTVLRPGDTARVLAFPDVEIDVAALFGR